MADAHRGLQDRRAGWQTEALHGVPHTFDDRGRGEVSVRSRGARGDVLVFGQEFAELMCYGLPFLERIGTEGVRHRSPAAVSGEHGLLRLGGVAVLGFGLFESADGLDVVEGLFAEAALSDAVGACYPEVSGGCFLRRWFEVPDDGGRGRSSFERNAHSAIAISHAAW